MKNLDLLIPTTPPTANGDWWTWATVTDDSPLRIRLDGDADPLDITPECLYDNPTVGQRVWVQMYNRRVIVHSPNGGQKPKPQVLMPIGWWNGTAGTSTNLPNDGITRTTHVINGTAVPSNAIAAQVHFDFSAQCQANAAVHWYFAASDGNGGYHNLSTDNIRHNQANTLRNMGATCTSTIDVRPHASKGWGIQGVVNGNNDPGSGAWVDVAYCTMTVTYLGLVTL